MCDASPAIDVHSHCVPRGFLPALAASSATFGARLETDADRHRVHLDSGHISGWFGAEMLDPAARRDRMQAQRVTRKLLSCYIDISSQFASPEFAPAHARALNDAIAAEIADARDVFGALADLPVGNAEAAAAELRRVTHEHRFSGAQIAAGDLSASNLDVLWATAEELRSILVIHPGAAGTSSLPFFLGNFVGNPYETTLAAASILLAGVFERFPDLRIVLVHGGGFLPYQIGRLQYGHEQYGARFGAQLTQGASLHKQMRKFYFDTIMHDDEALAHLIDVVGIGQIVVGSDDPFPMGEPDPTGALGRLTNLSTEERRRALHDTAADLIEAAGGWPGQPTATAVDSEIGKQ